MIGDEIPVTEEITEELQVDGQTQPATEPESEPEPMVDAGTPRVHIGRWIALVVVAALVFVGAAIAAVSASSSRSDAVNERDRSQALVASQRRATRAAGAERDAASRDAQALRVAIADPQATIATLVQLADQGLAAAQDAQRSGPEATVAAVDAYNEAVARGNAVGDQFDAALDRLTEQLRTLVGLQVRSV